MNIKTTCVHGSTLNFDKTGAVSTPIFQSATFAHPSPGESTGFDYSRLQNPTRQILEDSVANLEEGCDCVAFSSGMAAITALFTIFKSGDHIIASDDLYGGSHRLFSHQCMERGIEFSFIDTGDIQLVSDSIKENTRAIFIETPTNPMMQVSDIAAVKDLIADREIFIIVDNTFLTPIFQKPLQLGADIVIHSGTKYLGGHNDTLAGFAVVSSESLSEQIRFTAKTVGSQLAPFDSWLILRGLKTLALRMKAHNENALRVSGFLKTEPCVKKVHYVGLPEHPGHEVSLKQSSGFGGMISFEVDSPETAEKVLKNVKLIQFAESLGGVESLITYPVTQTHADVPEDVRAKKGITNTLLRLSVGIEDCEDIIEDLKNALRG